MRKLLLGAILALALLGAVGVGISHPLYAAYTNAIHAHQLAGPVCPGGSSTGCN